MKGTILSHQKLGLVVIWERQAFLQQEMTELP